MTSWAKGKIMKIISEQLTDKIFKNRWQSAVIGISTLLLLSLVLKIYHPKDGTFVKAITATFAFFGCIFVTLSVVAFQLDANRGEMRHRSDNPLWLNTFNRIMRMIIVVTLLTLTISSIWMAAEAWLLAMQ